MAVKTADNNGLVNQTWDGVYYSIVSGADIISCSWSSGSTQTNNIIQTGIASGAISAAAEITDQIYQVIQNTQLVIRSNLCSQYQLNRC